MKISGSKFLVTGGVSLIGSHVTERLLAQGAKEVVLFDNYSLSSPEALGEIAGDPRVKLVRGDILRVNELYDALDGVDGVFAIAGFLTLPLSQNPGLGLAVNIQGTVNTLEACRYRGVRKVIFSSSVATYGDVDNPMTDEAEPFRWSALQPVVALYSGSKILGESIANLYHDRHGVQSISLRYSSVYGERQHARAINTVYILETFDRIMRGERPAIPDDGLEVHDYIHAADVASANCMAMESEVSRESFNVVTGVSTTLNRLVELILQQAGSNLAPEYKAKASKVRGSASTKLRFSNEKIRSAIGWRPEVPIEDGITRVIAWRKGRP